MSKEITLSNIYNFIEGNIRLKTKSIQPSHIKEQIAYRLIKCKDDCEILKQCIICGCDFPDRAYSTESCNIERFPDFMSKLEWNKFKKDNNIE